MTDEPLEAVLATDDGKNVRIQDPDDRVVSAIKAALTFLDRKAFQMAAKLPESQRPDPYKRYYRKYSRSLTFPSGLRSRVERGIAPHGFTVAVLGDGKDEPVPYHHLIEGATLDPLQVQGNRQLLGVRRGVIELSVASGKTYTMANLAACFVKRYPELPVIVMVPKLQLLYQVQKDLALALPMHRIGLLGDGKRKVEQITVATSNTLTSDKLEDAVKEHLRSVGCFILDEGHHIVSASWQEVVNSNPDARVWGLSGKVTFTDELETLDVESFFGPPLMSARNEVRLCPVDVRIYDLDSRAWKKDKSPGQRYDGMPVYFTPAAGEPWVEAKYLENGLDGVGVYHRGRKLDARKGNFLYGIAEDFAVVLSGDRNAWAAGLVKALLNDPKAKVAVSVRRSIHLLMVANILRKAGVNCVTVSGAHSGAKQQSRWDRLNSDDDPLRVIVAQCSCMKEGTNVPSLTDLIRLDASVGDQINEQLKGRVERACEGKERGTVHIPGDYHNGSLRRRVLKVKKYYQSGKCRVLTV